MNLLINLSETRTIFYQFAYFLIGMHFPYFMIFLRNYLLSYAALAIIPQNYDFRFKS